MSTEVPPPPQQQHPVGLLAHEKPPRSPPRFEKGHYQINWISTAIIFVPIILTSGAVIAGVPFQTKTMWATFVFYLLSGLAVTAGYHRLFSHRAYSAAPLLQWVFAIIGAGAFEGSIKWWCRNHRIHHRYIDTDKDPYNAKRGFFYTHIGWMMMKQDYSVLGRVDIADLNCNHIVRFQHRHYLTMAILSGIVVPTLVCGLGWGDWLGGYFYAALLKMIIVHHTTFFINSIAHTDLFGAQRNYSEEHSSHDSWVCALFTLGEGYHNFHHEFAQDYRNGVRWYHFDPTKWLIRALECVGLARGLVRTPTEVIRRNYCSVKHRRHQRLADAYAAKVERMERASQPKDSAVWDWEEINRRVASGEKLMVIGSWVIDLRKSIPTGHGYTHRSQQINWYNAHPGGRKILDMYVGKDATEAFTGGVYRHSNGAANLLTHLRVAALKKDYTM